MLQDFELFSCNLSPACEDYKIYSNIDYSFYDARSRILLISEIVKLVRERVKKIKPYFKYVAVENSNRYLQSSYTNICDPKVLSKVVEENDIYFCFDIAHAITSYRNYYYGVYVTLEEFIFAHPLDRCIEIHISSPGPDEAPFCDRHLAPTDYELDIFEKVLNGMYNGGNRYRNLPLYIAIEYYGEINILAACYDRVKEMIK